MTRAGAWLGVAGLVLLGANSSLQTAVAEDDTRTLSFHHVHTGEDITVTFKRNGRYDEAALKKLDWFMRDWRMDQEIHMDPHLFDLLWETYREVGGKDAIQVICGYRSAGTNAMLRARSSAVAQFSQHIDGNAIDFYIPGVPLDKIRAEGLRLQRGGVGFYPTSGSPFVHLDTGSVRHWPRIARDQLVKIFPNGRTVHIPADGKPLPGYALALADVERRGSTPSEVSLETAREAGVITASQEQAAEPQPKRSLFADLFGSSKNQTDESGKPAPRRARAPLALASLSPTRTVAVEHIVPLPAARPKPVEVAVALPMPRPAEQRIVTASLASSTFDNRVAWRGAVETGPALRPAIAAGTPFETASAEPVAAAGMTDDALAYAAQPELPRATRARPMGSHLPRLPVEARGMMTPANLTVIAKAPLTPGIRMEIGGQRSDSPWLRAAMLTPSVRGFMTATRIGKVNARWQHELLHKPVQSLVATFSADPHLGMVADRFSGSAVVFLATATFAMQTTAALQ